MDGNIRHGSASAWGRGNQLDGGNGWCTCHKLGCFLNESVMPDLMGNPCVKAQPGQGTLDMMAELTHHF
eukprot:3417179-Amphidinium_carterae.1